MSQSAEIPAPPSNRLSIAHLMLWTFCCAAILGGYRLVLEQQLGGPEAEGLEAPRALLTRLLVYFGFFSLPLGAQAAGGLLWAYRKVTRRGGFPTQPGHWLLIAEGVAALGTVAGQVMVFGLATWGAGSESLWLLCVSALYLPGSIASVIFYALTLRSVGYESKAWPAALIGLLALRGLPAFVLISFLIAAETGARGTNWDLLIMNVPSWCWCLELPVVILVAVAAFGDPERNSRDFLHWTGVNALIAVSVIQLFATFTFPLAF